MRSLLIVTLIYIIATIIILTPNCSKASTYDVDVDWPTSKGNVHSLRVSINGCDTIFLLKTNELEKLNNDNNALDKVIKTSIDHYKTGCQ
jgi:hypothetical protein